MEEGRQKRFLFFFLGMLVLLVSANLVVMFGSSSKITGKAPQEASVQFEIMSLDSCGNGTCDSTETCSNCVADCGCSTGYTCTSGTCVADEVSKDPGGGSGGTVSPPTDVYDFELNPSSLRMLMQKGEIYQKQIAVTNKGTKDLLINVSLVNLDKFIILDKESFVLEKDEIEYVKFKVYASEKTDADVYLGKINFNSQYVSKTVNTVLNIKDEISLFDIKTTVLKRYLLPGELVEAEVEIVNLGEEKNIEVDFEYSVRDFNNETLVSKNTSFVIDEIFNGKFSLETDNFEMGEYIFYSKVMHGGESASSYDSFSMEKLSFFIWVVIVAIITVLIIILVVIIIKRRQKEEKVNLVRTSP